MKRVKNNYLIEISALNFNKFLNYAIQNNIKVTNVKNLEDNLIQLNICNLTDEEFKKLVELFGVRILNQFGFSGLKNMLFQKLGLIIGIMVSIILVIIFNGFIFNVSITGLSIIPEERVIKTLNDLGVKKNGISKFSSDQVEDYLKEQIEDISLVSVKKVGTSLIINIKEKLENTKELKTDLIAPYNMLITNIQVFSGTANVKIGDSVNKGQVLVYAYMEDGSGEIINCQPSANIESDIWFTNEIYFKPKQIIQVRNGNKQVQTNIFIGGKLLKDNITESKFEKYEMEVKEFIISEFLLPIKVKKVIYYETEEVEIERSFESEKDLIISECYAKAKAKIPAGLEIEKEDIVVSDAEDGYIVSVYLKSTYNIRSDYAN